MRQVLSLVFAAIVVASSSAQQASTRVYTEKVTEWLESNPGQQFATLSVSDTGLPHDAVVSKLSSAANAAGLEVVVQSDRILLRTPGHQRVGMSSPRTQGAEVISVKMTGYMFLRVQDFVNRYNQNLDVPLIRFAGVELVSIDNPHSSNNRKWDGSSRWDYSCICTVSVLVKN